MAKEFLSQQNIYFVEKDVNTDSAARYELQKRNITGVPALLIGDEMVVGFDKARILQLVDHRMVQCEHCSQKLRVPINKGKIQVTCPKCSKQFTINT